ncbi:CD320 antigen isoform X2 [Trichosurus vulpecula]|uniref:CD320 antigen isoform X2 n=1 Tax=Trichosurus vulpecula TaxID=9337 RepID=UPI00186AF422|nr:CD320 antigen isoform X2 [Trichosurus vulpecula]
MARALLRLLPLLLAGLQRTLALSLPSAPAQPRSLARRGTEEPCPPSKFPCGGGICIPSEWLCDGDKDCSDGRDETHCPADSCAPGEKRCPSDTCSPVRCEGPECTDVWIEASCPLPPCLAEYRFCDDINDCPNGTDEQLMDCKKHRSKMSSPRCTRQDFQCASGVCIPHAWVCDGHPDCVSGNDELHCGVTQTAGDQTTTPGHGSLTPSERRSAYGLVMAAAALSGVLAAACLLVCCQTWAQVRWRLLPQPNLVEVVKESLLMPERTPSSLI